MYISLRHISETGGLPLPNTTGNSPSLTTVRSSGPPSISTPRLQPLPISFISALAPLSDSQENFPAVHPEQNHPVNNQHASAEEQRLVCFADSFEAVLAQVGL